MERLGRNAAVGMRSHAIMRSDETWSAGHQAAWPKARQAAIALFVGSLASAVVLPYTSDDTGAVKNRQTKWRVTGRQLVDQAIYKLVFLDRYHERPHFD